MRHFSRAILAATLSCALLNMGCSGSSGPASDATSTTPGPAVEETTPQDTARVPQDSPEPEPEPKVPELTIIRPGEVVPAFELEAEDGTVLDSRELVGRRPFVMVFFASWCRVCERKLPEVKAALNEIDDLLVIGVALDNPDTWDRVAPYVKKHGIEHFKLVRGQDNRRFATAYNPFGSVPIVEVIDRSGVIAELQRGWKPGHKDKLATALEHVTTKAM